MNRTQKVAWIFLFSAVLGAVTAAYVGSIFVLGRMPPRPFGQIVAFVAFAFLALTIFALAGRQSRGEPEADERDKMIWRKAAAISFVGSWLLLGVVVLILGLTLGQTGTIPVYVLTIILWGVAMVTMLVYAVAILVQYGWGRKGEQP